jgi:hypothetical protein
MTQHASPSDVSRKNAKKSTHELVLQQDCATPLVRRQSSAMLILILTEPKSPRSSGAFSRSSEQDHACSDIYLINKHFLRIVSVKGEHDSDSRCAG